MSFPLEPPIEPMLAKIAEGIPESGDWLFEPKWDGFRAIIFRDGEELLIQSRDKKPLDRYFPELREPLLAGLPKRCVVDGEVILIGPNGLDFGALQLRLHPAESRVNRLAAETPAAFVAFDLLALDDRDLRKLSQEERRSLLEQALGEPEPPFLMVTPVTRSRATARRWFDTLEGAGIEGLIAKPASITYQPKKRVLSKIKHVRTVDCVVAGFRWHKNGPGELVGSLLLGLYDQQERLHHVGITSSFKMTERRKLATLLEPYREGARADHPWMGWDQAPSPEEASRPRSKRPSGSRWTRGKSLAFEPLRLERVAEVKFDYLQNGRFRHASTFLRWRTDKSPADCRFDQVEKPAPVDLATVFS